MKPVDRYLSDVLRNVFATPEDRERLEADLRAHFAEAEARGERPARIVEGLGTPAEVAAAFNAERPIRYAGFWQRAVAFAGDCGVLGVLALPLLALVVYLDSRGVMEAGPRIGWTISMAVLALGFFGAFVFYFPLLEARFGRTLGKQLLRIRVLREDGAPIGLGQAFVRRLSLFFKLLVLDALFVPFTDRKQRALDIIAKTVVAREPGEAAPAWGYALCLLLPILSLTAMAGVALLCAPG